MSFVYVYTIGENLSEEGEDDRKHTRIPLAKMDSEWNYMLIVMRVAILR